MQSTVDYTRATSYVYSLNKLDFTSEINSHRNLLFKASFSKEYIVITAIEAPKNIRIALLTVSNVILY